MKIHTFRLVKLYIVWSTSFDSDFINGPKPTFYTSAKKTCESTKKSSTLAKHKRLIVFSVSKLFLNFGLFFIKQFE